MSQAPLLIYVAGPYRAPTTWEIHKNIHNARLWGVVLAKQGAYPVIPHSNTAHMDGAASDDLWLPGTLELLRRCDGAIFIEGWRDSKGSKIEREECRKMGKPVLEVDGWNGRGGANIANDVIEWLDMVKVIRDHRPVDVES
jgi:hypothetical protein